MPLCFLFLITLTPFQADKVEIFMENDQRIVHLIGNVIIEGEATRITCAEAKISEEEGWVKLTQDVRLEDHNGLASAGFAIYYFNEDRGYLRDSVHIVTSDEEIMADSLYYDGSRDSVEMYGRVMIKDTRNDMIVTGDRGWYNLADDKGLLTGDPKLQIMRQGKDPMTVDASTFALLTGQDMFHGYDSVKATIDSITVFCDTFAYDLVKEKGTMTRPRILQKNNELTGTHGLFVLADKQIEMMSVINGESVYYTAEGSENYVKGDTISIMFEQGKAKTIAVQGAPKGKLSLKRSEQSAGD